MKKKNDYIIMTKEDLENYKLRCEQLQTLFIKEKNLKKKLEYLKKFNDIVILLRNYKKQFKREEKKK